MKRVFLSHNSEDKPVARKIAHLLKEYGIYVWIDEAEIKIGDSLINKIGEALENVDYLLVLLSTHSISSNWVNKELNVMMTKEITMKETFVLPVLIENCSIPTFLKDKLYADMTTKKNEKDGLRKLLMVFGIDENDHTKKIFLNDQYTVVDLIIKYKNTTQNYERITLLNQINVDDRELFSYKIFRDFFQELLTSEKQILITSINIMSRLLKYRFPIDKDNSTINEMREYCMDYYANWICNNDEDIVKTAIDSLAQLDIFEESQYEIIVQLIQTTKDQNIINSCANYLLKVEYISKKHRHVSITNKHHPLVPLLTSELIKQKLTNDTIIELIVGNWKSGPFGDSFFVLLNAAYEHGTKGEKHRIIGELLYQNDLDNYLGHPLYRKYFRDIFYDVMWTFDDYEMRGRFLAYCLGKRTEDVFDEADILYALNNEHNEYTMGAFIDSLETYSVYYYLRDDIKELIADQFKYYSQKNQTRWQKRLDEIFGA